MLTLKLCESACPNLIPPNIGRSLGDGSDGQVFQLSNDSSRVIKISALFCYFDEDIDSHLNKIEQALIHLIVNPDDSYARVYDYKNLGKYSREIFSDRISLGEEQEYYLYHYVMERCFKLSEDEKKVFHSILCHEDRGIEKNYTTPQLKNILTGLSKGLDFDENKVMLFCDNLKRSRLRHLDLHVRNIMKSNSGDFKLVDFDRTRLD